MDARLQQLYQQVIIKHSKSPFQYEKWEDAPHQVDANNPVCGDRFQLFFELENGRIQKMTFYGHGCAISKASTSVLVKHLQGKTIPEAIDYCAQMETIVNPAIDEQHPDEELSAFEAARQFPERATCATLSWEKLKEALEQV